MSGRLDLESPLVRSMSPAIQRRLLSPGQILHYDDEKYGHPWGYASLSAQDIPNTRKVGPNSGEGLAAEFVSARVHYCSKGKSW
jgi:hypothetical protein